MIRTDASRTGRRLGAVRRPVGMYCIELAVQRGSQAGSGASSHIRGHRPVDTQLAGPGFGCMNTELIEKLRSEIESSWPRQVDWLQRLVRIPSLRGSEQECQNWIATELAVRGWNVDRFSLADVDIERLPGFAPLAGIDPRRSIQVVATVDPALSTREPGRGRSLILQGHVDVVPPGPEDMWADPPFSGIIRDRWLYGRGAQDMKSGISALVFALDAIQASQLGLGAPVYLQLVTEEESTGNGALATLARGYRADACLIPEPTMNTITRAQCGAVWFKLKVRSNPIHVERMLSGANAIFSSFALLQALQALTERLNIEARLNRWFKNVPEPIKFNPGVIRGGDWPSSTPSWCEVDCRLGLLPGMNVADLRRAVIDTVAAASAGDPILSSAPAEIEWHGFLADASVLEPGSDAELTLAEAHRAIFGATMLERLSTAVNDTRYYAIQQGIPALCYGPAGECLHGFNERADLANLKKTTLVIATFIATWCGAMPRDRRQKPGWC